jgi:hypothetical protein
MGCNARKTIQKINFSPKVVVQETSCGLKVVASQRQQHRSQYLVNHESQGAADCLVTRTKLQLLAAHYSLIFMLELF